MQTTTSLPALKLSGLSKNGKQNHDDVSLACVVNIQAYFIDYLLCLQKPQLSDTLGDHVAPVHS